MKRTFIFTALLLFFVALQAQKVALHSSTGITMFTGTGGLVSACTAAQAGDTIYIPGGGFTSPGTISKKLLIFGAGHYPDSTKATSKTFINSGFTLTGDADGFRMEGVDVSGAILFSYNEAVNNVIIKYCKITGDMNVQGTLTNPSTNFTLINSVVTGTLSLSNAENAGILNCIIQGRIVNSYGNLISNSISLFTYTGSTIMYSLSGDNNTLTNNIFMNESYRYILGTSNRLFYNAFIVAPALGNTPEQEGNYYPVVRTDVFMNFPANNFDYASNYNLQSPEVYIGTDGNQIGIYGGVHLYKEGAVPSNPHIQVENVAPTTSNGVLNVRITAAAQEK